MYKHILNMAQQRMRREALENRASIIGKITSAYPGKLYDVQTADGKTYRKIGNALPVNSFEIGTWVTMEWTGVDWHIIAYSGEAASDGA